MSRRERPGLWQLVVVVALGAAAIVFVVAMTVTLLLDGVGTGDPADYVRAIGRGLSDAGTWRAVATGAVVGAVGTLVVAGVARLVRRH